MAPVAKVGGLGDVVTGLSKEMIARGNIVEVILPYYECLERHFGTEAMTEPLLETTFMCPKGRVWDGRMQLGELKTDVYRCEIEGVPVALIRPDWDSSNIFKVGLRLCTTFRECSSPRQSQACHACCTPSTAC